jgi:hypothetical protein
MSSWKLTNIFLLKTGTKSSRNQLFQRQNEHMFHGSVFFPNETNHGFQGQTYGDAKKLRCSVRGFVIQGRNELGPNLWGPGILVPYMTPKRPIGKREVLLCSTRTRSRCPHLERAGDHGHDLQTDWCADYCRWGRISPVLVLHLHITVI